MILLVGGTGTVGRHLARRLAEQGRDFAVLSREPDRARAQLGPSVRIVAGDLSAPDSLPAALRGAASVYLATESSDRQVRLETTLIDAAARAGVRHVVKLSGGLASYGATNVYGAHHARIESHLIASGMGWTMLRPNWFMENFLGMADGVAAQGILYGAAGERKIGFVAADDIASVAALALTQGGHDRHIHTLTGPEALSFAEAAAVLSAVTGRTIPYVDASPEQFAQALEGIGLPAPVIDLLTAGFRSVRMGSFDSVTATIPALTGQDATRLADFLARHAAAFSREPALA